MVSGTFLFGEVARHFGLHDFTAYSYTLYCEITCHELFVKFQPLPLVFQIELFRPLLKIHDHYWSFQQRFIYLLQCITLLVICTGLGFWRKNVLVLFRANFHSRLIARICKQRSACWSPAKKMLTASNCPQNANGWSCRLQLLHPRWLQWREARACVWYRYTAQNHVHYFGNSWKKLETCWERYGVRRGVIGQTVMLTEIVTESSCCKCAESTHIINTFF